MNIATIYALAALLALVIGAPIALLAPLLAPLLLPALVSLPADEVAHGAPMALEASQTVDTAAPFVAVYARRGSRVAVTHPVRRSQATVAASYACLPSDLKGAARKAAAARASRKARVSPMCATVSR